MPGVNEVHVVSVFVAFSGKTLYLTNVFSPTVISIGDAANVTDVTGISTVGFLLTVTFTVALIPFTTAAIVVVPTPTAFTKPFSSTVATVLSAEDHVIFLSVAFSGVTFAVNCCSSPSFIEILDAPIISTPVTGTMSALSVTVTRIIADLPLLAFAVIIAVPAARPKILPSSVTKAILISLEE